MQGQGSIYAGSQGNLYDEDHSLVGSGSLYSLLATFYSRPRRCPLLEPPPLGDDSQGERASGQSIS